MEYQDSFKELYAALEGPGAFLVAEDKSGRVNLMTIGWALAGIVWGKPVLTVLVRPSRHTHRFLSKAGYFSVFAPAAGTLAKELAFCGSRSGRDYDKARVCSLKLKEGVKKSIKYIEGPGVVWQCALLGGTGLAADTLPAALQARYYPAGDAHTLYFGEVLRTDRFAR